MVKYTLVYFNGRGRAEVARFLFAQAGVEYEDRRIEVGNLVAGEWPPAEWERLKPETPTGQLPYLEIDGLKVGQSMAIARYLARKFSLYGTDDMETLKIDMLCECVCQVVEHSVRYKYCEGDVKAHAGAAITEEFPRLMKLLSDTLVDNGTGWLVGNQVSLADFVAFQYIELLLNYGNTEELVQERQKHDEVLKHAEHVANLPKSKEWIAKRPVTGF